ncbi:AraC-like protein [Aquimarina sp. MAR_2010_214]|uniref:AraC family ligand binding domain-containing protein n=1 Tax=Aquimarina sp. MAR_2010_214 TaxID=1250026 RepID=UPI000C70F1B0|nr:AraC family ligand binding domain-containing protein [Aquimarina sp. MAR_2010_214]PKV48024.1 AraC-like protein [Aquimarina sp. MAR_2010_214]PKV53181.1 AraC-like protein [Aquimarina sp. MAR_2010_214]
MTNEIFGAHYFHVKNQEIFESDLNQLYFFTSYIGLQKIKVEKGDCVYYFDSELKEVKVQKGPCTINSKYLATVIRGYMHPNASFSLEGVTTLPYVNGCSTKQLFPPIRLGDPTLQYLKMPPFSKEQEHHIHSTFRVVLIVEGVGKSIVGIENRNIVTDLEPGSVCILEPMCPHHFETDTEKPLIAIPLHIYSSVGALEKNHPMFNGTVMI